MSDKENFNGLFIDEPFAVFPANVPFEELPLGDHTARYAFSKAYVIGRIVLDAGCGVGYGADYLVQNGANFAVGLDISIKAIKIAKSRYKNANIDFIVADCAKLPFKNGAFEVILSFEVIEHLLDHEKFLFEVVRCLKDVGVFISSTPNKLISSPNGEKSLSKWHVKEFSPDELHQVLLKYFQRIFMSGERPRKLSINVMNGIARVTKKVKEKIPTRIKRIYIQKLDSERTNLKCRDYEISQLRIDTAPTLVAVCLKY